MIYDYVTSLELSKKLKEIDVKQNSLFYRFDISNTQYLFCKYYEQYSKHVDLDINDGYSAFLASELLDLLPHSIFIQDREPFGNFRLNIEKSFHVKNASNLLDREKHPQAVLLEEIKYEIIYIINYFCDSTTIDGESAWMKRKLNDHPMVDENICNALAKMIIWLYENGYIKNDHSSDNI